MIDTIELGNETINTLLQIQYKVCSVFAPFTTKIIDKVLQTGNDPEQEEIDQAAFMDATWLILMDACRQMAPEQAREFLVAVKDTMTKERGVN